MDADVLRAILDTENPNAGIDARLWASLAYQYGYSPADIAATVGVTRRTITTWKNRYHWAKRNPADLKINAYLRRVLAIELLSCFLAPVSRQFGIGPPKNNRNNELSGIYGREGQRYKAIIMETKIFLRQMEAERKRMQARLPRFD